MTLHSVERFLTGAVVGMALLIVATDPQPVTPKQECVVLDVTPWFDLSEASDAPDLATPLIKAGWHSDPNDGKEAMYSPGCK